MGPGQRGHRGQGGDGVRRERDRPGAAAGEFGHGRDADDLPGCHGVDLAGAQRPFGAVDGDQTRAFLDVDQDEEVVGVPVAGREIGVGGLGVEAHHRHGGQAGTPPVAVHRRPIA